jgi:Tol biopolymer transport system component/C-terminal processing protease CtpA/Prc
MNRLKTVLIFNLLPVFASLAQDNPLWLRYPAISPDGQTIAFEWKGDIYSVPAVGGTAAPLTMSESYEYAPVWSHDGKKIAFASDRYGSFDVFVMPATGGEAKRLTFHSAPEVPTSFTADDSAVLFSAYRQEPAPSAQFPIPLLAQLYSVPVSGGRVSLVLPAPALDATLDSGGTKLIYHDIKGYESVWRKHHTSSVTRDVWVYDFQTSKGRKLTGFNGEDRNPVFGANGDEFFYLSEQGGSFNVFKSSLSDPSKAEAITHFARHPVRFLSRSKNDNLCFSFDGEVYTLRPGEEPRKVPIRIAQDGRETIDRIVPVNEGFTEAKLSPNGKECAYVFRGEIFVTSLEGGITKRITNTPWQERSVDFSPDGRSIVYAAEKDSNWNIYMASIARKEEPYFFASTVLKVESVVDTSAEEYQPAFSPDGKEVAYLENRVTLKVVKLATKETRTIMTADKNYSYDDRDQYYAWSPDGKWFLAQFGYPERVLTPEVGLVSADGKGEFHDLTMSGYDNFRPKWGLDGKVMIWGSDREGTRGQGGDPAGGDIYEMFFSKAAFDRFNLTKEELALAKEREELDKKEDGEKKNADEPKAKTGAAEKKKEIVIDWEGLPERKSRLTVHTSPASDWVLSKDGEKLYYLTSFEKGNDLWEVDLRAKETRLFSKLGAKVTKGEVLPYGQPSGMQLSADGKFIFLLADGKPMKIATEDGKFEALKTGGEMVLRQGDERRYIFDHAWRQFKEKFYVADLQGVDWEYYYKAYERFLPFINNNYDFAEMLSEMLGEANASHTGCYYSRQNPNSDETAELGVIYDLGFTGRGAKIAEVVTGGPLDKASSKVRAGDIIEAIDGQAVSPDLDFAQLLNRKSGKLTLLSVFNPAEARRWDEPVKPVSGGEENALLYKRWVRNRRDEVEKLSKGKLGYIHVRAMDDGSMRTVFDEALGRNIGKKAIIVDTRFNGGGYLHEQLSDFLNGKKYFDVIPHGQYVGSEPFDKWTKPSLVLIGESNYSDAHLFPVAYRLKGVGKTLGMPVPGTGTFVWWEEQIDPSLVFGVPMGGWRTPDGKFCENNQLEPDIKVQNDPELLTAGRDQQIEAAVAELLKL